LYDVSQHAKLGNELNVYPVNTRETYAQERLMSMIYLE